MNDTPSLPPPEEQPPVRNPETQARHEHDTFWQITVPVVIGATLMAALIILVILSDASYVSRWGDIALIWVLPCPMIFALIISGILGGMAYGMWKLLAWLPGFFYKVQGFFILIQAKVTQFADILAEPVLRTQSAAAGAKRFPDSLQEPLRPEEKVKSSE